MQSILAMVLDDSSSMQSSAPATRAGFNEFMKLQQMRLDDCTFVMAKFAGSYTRLHQFVSIFEVGQLTEQSYNPQGGSTALYDAIRRMVADIDAKIESLPKEQRPHTVTLVVQSDGGNNFGETTHAQCAKVLQDIRKRGWGIVFLANGQEAAACALATPEEKTAERDALRGVTYGPEYLRLRRAAMQGPGFLKSEVIEYDPAKTQGVFTDVGIRIVESMVTGNVDLEGV